MKTLRALLKTMRPQQWTKNVIVFAALVFDVKLLDLAFAARTAAGFVLFCLISGVVYTINDLVDLEKDRHHPRKQHRPLPSGQLNAGAATAVAVILGAGSLGAGFALDTGFGAYLTGYLVLQLAYSFVLKNVVLIDAMAIAAGFVLRVAAGSPLVGSAISPWLYLCTVLLALFLALSKRRGELIALGEDAGEHRPILLQYNLPLLDQLIGMVTSSIILAYSLYTFSPSFDESAGFIQATRSIAMLTIPFVIYGLFRYLYLIHMRQCTLAPDEVLLSDHPMQVDLLLWGLSWIIILYV